MTRVAVSMFAPILALVAACSSTETSESSALEICDITPCDSAHAPGTTPPAPTDEPPVCDCGPAPSLPSEICIDGTVAGPTCVATSIDACGWIITECPDPQPTDCSQSDCPTGQHCETDCYPCDAPDPKTPCDSFTCQSTCVPD